MSEPESLHEKHAQYEILKKLLIHGEGNFNTIAQNTNRNKCGKRLNILLKKGLITKNIKKVKTPQATTITHHFNLTTKGREFTIRQQLITSEQLINTGLDELENVLSCLEPEKVKEIFDRHENINRQKMINDNKNVFEKRQADYVMAEVKEHRPIFSSMFRLHAILTKLRAPNAPLEDYTTIIKGQTTVPLTVPLRFLEGIDFNHLFLLGHFKGAPKIKWTATFIEDSKACDQKEP